jgi:hypothetical protein
VKLEVGIAWEKAWGCVASRRVAAKGLAMLWVFEGLAWRAAVPVRWVWEMEAVWAELLVRQGTAGVHCCP